MLDENELDDWAYSKVSNITHTITENNYDVGVSRLVSLVKGTVKGMIGDIPGVLSEVSELTKDICNGSEDRTEGETFIKTITDKDGHEGILILKALNESTFRKKMFGASKYDMKLTGLLGIFIPLTDKARNHCMNLKNNVSESLMNQIVTEFNFTQ